MNKFKDELQHLLNRCSLENGSNTPDFILAQYLYSCLNAFDIAVCRRTDWYGHKDWPKNEITGPEPVEKENK